MKHVYEGELTLMDGELWLDEYPLASYLCQDVRHTEDEIGGSPRLKFGPLAFTVEQLEEKA